jgi:NTP pyrophosphatase (non-canonical NTP hydrolase)
MDLKQLQDELAAMAAERGLGAQQTPKNLAMAVAADAGALLALFRWLSEEQSWRLGGESDREAAAEALADVLMHALRLADELGIDLAATLAEKLAPKARARETKRVARPAPLPARPAEPAVETPAPIEAPPSEVASAAAPAELDTTAEEGPEAPPPVEAARIEEPLPPSPEVAPKEAPRIEAPPAEEPPRRKEKKPTADATPSWLDGLIPPRPHGRGRKAVPEPKAPAIEDAVVAVEPPPAPPARSAAPEPVAPAATEPDPAIVEVPEPTGVAVTPERPAARPTEKERYTDLDPEATKALVRSLARRVDGARSDDPLLRELHDELETLRRALYSPNPKRSWLADSLITIRNMLEEAAQHSVGGQIRADEHIAQIQRMLKA